MNRTTSNSVVCIAGAHRSGTSMVARLLRSCGLELGPESELMPARPDNPDGFWENLRFVALNDEILNELGGAWDLPPPRDVDFQSAGLDPLRARAQRLIEEFDSTKTWGWKDPRNSLTLPFWRGLLPRLKVLVVVRNPLEVAYSMRQRNGTSYSFGLRLWEIYNRRVAEWMGMEEGLVTHYDSFFADPETELARITRFVDLPLSRIEEAAALVTSRKRHTQFTLNELIDARVSSDLVELYKKLLAAARAPSERVPETTSMACATQAQPPGNKSSDGGLLPGAISRLNVSIPDRLTQLHDAMRAVGDLQRELARRDSQLIESEQALATIRERFLQTNRLLHSRSISVAEAEARFTELTTSFRKQLWATKKLMRFLQDFEDAATRLRSSRRWKIANPVAALKAKFSGGLLPGYGHLEKVVSIYSHWRIAHPEAAAVDDAIQALNRGAISSRALALKNPAQPVEPRIPTKPIEFKVHDQVEVSIVIPVFNQFHFTQACLASIQEHEGSERFETIVVDDCSTDATGDVVSKIPGLLYLRNENNLGFVASCNRGAEIARGNFLVFLNNDTEVTAGWVSALLETFAFEPRAGLVGSKLIFPDGRLQEAGGIIWRDGSGWNRGKFEDPDKPEYNFLREVDYCSAACLMVPKSLFEAVGAFDTKYAPGYYEDTDLAFKIRRQGFKVLYQPVSEVIHYEGGTGGTDLSAGAKRYQEINRTIFAETWADVLAQKPANGDLASYYKLGPEQKRILVIDHHLPMPDRDSGSLRMFQILKILYHLAHRVTFVPDNVANIPPYADELQKRGIEVIYHPHVKSVRDYLERYGHEFDVVILSRCDFARKHISDVRLHAPQSRLIFDTVDLNFLRTEREADLTNNSESKLMAKEKQEQEYQLIDQADETWVVSDFEQQLLRRERPDKTIEVVSNIVDVPGSAIPFSLRRDFLFIGSFQHSPNIDAVLFFTKEIYPLIEGRLDRAKFYIIGDKAPPEVIGLASETVIITGLQPDIRPYFDSVKLSIAPLRFGAGVKGKINQSMGFGVPVVATSVAVEGMGLTNREDVLIADAPRDFAQAVIDLYESEELWERVSKNGIEKTKAMFSSEVAKKQLARLFSDSHVYSSARRQTGNESIASSSQSSDGIHYGAAR